MTPTDEELVRWSAEVLMGWTYLDMGNDIDLPFWYPIGINVKSWNPLDKSNGQIWDVVEKMRELGFIQFQIYWNRYLNNHQGSYGAHFGKSPNEMGDGKDPNPAQAILKAAWAAVEGK